MKSLLSTLLASLMLLTPCVFAADKPAVLSGSVKQTVAGQSSPSEPGVVGLDMRILPGGVSYPLITNVIKGTPAYKQGVHSGDMIMEIDNESTLGKSDTQIDAMISNVPGTNVVFTLLRAGRILKLQLNVAPLSSVSGF